MQSQSSFQEFKCHRLYKYLLSAIIVGITTIIQYIVWPWIEPAPFLLYYPCVILASLYGDGNSAVLMTGVLGQYYFVEPYGKLSIESPNDFIRLGIYMLSAFLIRKIVYQLQAARLKAEESRKDLESEKDLREKFVATLTHDLQTPLTAARLNLQMIQRKVENQQYVLETAQKGLAKMTRIEHMIRDLLDATKIRAKQPLPFDMSENDLSKIVELTIQEMKIIHGDRFITETVPDIKGHWNADGLRRVIENLCSNAVKYGDPASPITVRVLSRPHDAVIEVHNHGTQIKDEDKKKIFDAFIQTGSEENTGKRGWGLGLTLVRAIAEAHNGKVELESLPEIGTTFRVILPKMSVALAKKS